MSDPNTIDLALLSDAAIRRIYQDFRVCLPAAALNFDRDASLVTASPRVQFMLYNREVVVDPNVPSVPVLHYGGGGYGMWFDVADADPLLMVAADGPVTGFYSSGGAAPPGAATTSHTWGCAVALPCGRVSDPAAPTPPPNAAGECVVGAADGTSTLTFHRADPNVPADLGQVVVATGGDIRAGSATASFAVALATLVQQNLTSLNTAIQSWTPVPNDGGASLKAVFGTWVAGLADMADAKLKGDGPV